MTSGTLELKVEGSNPGVISYFRVKKNLNLIHALGLEFQPGSSV